MNICITLADQPLGQSQSCLSQLAQLKRTMAQIQTISVHLLNSILEADLANERGVVVVTRTLSHSILPNWPMPLHVHLAVRLFRAYVSPK